MPWPPNQARAIAASYRKRGARIPRKIASELSKSLRGKDAKKPPGRKKKRRKKLNHGRRVRPPKYRG